MITRRRQRKTLRRRGGVPSHGGLRSRGSRRHTHSPHPSSIPNTAEPFDIQRYQTELVGKIVRPFHDIKTNPENPYVVYEVDDEVLRAHLHDYFLFQTPADFQFEWLEQSKAYVRNLTNFQKNILRSYTRHGDELVNAYLRNPEGFQTDTRVQELLFDVMPRNFTLPFASHIAEDYISQQMDRSYAEDDFFDDVGDVRELGQHVQQIFIDDVLRENPVNWDVLRRYIDRYVSDFHEIFRAAPRTSAPLLVFRGVVNDYMNQVDTPVLMKGYTSTTYSIDIARNFAGDGRQVYEMILLPGTPCLAMDYVSEFEGLECEVLVDSHVYAVAEKNFEKRLLHPNIAHAEPVVPDIVLRGENEPLASRMVILHPPEAEGGFSTKTRRFTKRIRSSTTRQQTKKRTQQHKQQQQRRSVAKRMYGRSDPTPMWGAPVPSYIQSRLRSALSGFRNGRRAGHRSG